MLLVVDDSLLTVVAIKELRARVRELLATHTAAIKWTYNLILAGPKREVITSESWEATVSKAQAAPILIMIERTDAGSSEGDAKDDQEDLDAEDRGGMPQDAFALPGSSQRRFSKPTKTKASGLEEMQAHVVMTVSQLINDGK